MMDQPLPEEPPAIVEPSTAASHRAVFPALDLVVGFVI